MDTVQKLFLIGWEQGILNTGIPNKNWLTGDQM